MPHFSVSACFLWSLACLSQFGDVHAQHIKRPPKTPQKSNEPQVDANGYDLNVVDIDTEAADHYEDFHNYITRPDIDAPRWDVKIYDEKQLAPGYWFVGPYQKPVQQSRGGGWVGPHIYDNRGELVWSGVPQFNGFDTFDFRVQNVAGQDMLTMIYRHENAVILDKNYEMQWKLNIKDDKAELNMHDFNMVDNGTRALMLKTITKKASKDLSQKAGYHNGKCKVRFYGFEEQDLFSRETLFSWTSEGHIGLNEIGAPEKEVKQMCSRGPGWDYVHANAIDKFPNGDYIMSSRHTSTIVKISGQDGSIIWRFGGKMSDFEWDDTFSGQHDVRLWFHNDTHTIITFLDNAFLPNGHPKYTHDFSRGFKVLLRTDLSPMTAETLTAVDHPTGEYAPGRGSFQDLSNGNSFVGWTSFSMHSEYSPNGTILMEAKMRPELKSYRNYKFEWQGYPTQPPDVHSAAIGGWNESLVTQVHVSWNGATEVDSWVLFKTTPEGETKELVANVPRNGFETVLTYRGFASYVMVEGLDRHGLPLGKSNIVKTIPPMDSFSEPVAEEHQWVQEHQDPENRHQSTGTSLLTNPLVTFGLGVIGCGIGVIFGICIFKFLLQKRPVDTHQNSIALKSFSPRSVMDWWRRRPPSYESVPEGEEKMFNLDDESLSDDDLPEEGSSRDGRIGREAYRDAV